MISKLMIEEAVLFLKKKGFKETTDAVILGTGLNELANCLDSKIVVDYEEIPYFPSSTESFHKGKLIFGKMDGKQIFILAGRFHLYEGYTLSQVTFPVRVVAALGLKNLIITNASGGINDLLQKGDIMLIEDHINLQGKSPLALSNVEDFGDRFVDMIEPYKYLFIEKLEKIAKKLDIEVKRGVYAAVYGPQLETRAEYKFLKIIGADSIGMSTVPEVIVANHLNIATLGLSIITDECHIGKIKPINISEIMEVVMKAELKLIILIRQFLGQLK